MSALVDDEEMFGECGMYLFMIYSIVLLAYFVPYYICRILYGDIGSCNSTYY
jgi:hypothetical protein